MKATLESVFRSGNGRRVRWQGRVVHSVFPLTVKDGDTVQIRRLSASRTRAQALKLSVDKGDLRANGILTSTAAIWTHTSPDQVSLEVVGRRARSIDVWNSWSFQGVDSSWLGSAGMIVDHDDSGAYTIRCSDGLGQPTFDDLVVQLLVVSGG